MSGAPCTPGTLIHGAIRLIRVVGKGSFGVVWHARHLELDTDVAVKLLNEDKASNEDPRNRFLREARTLAKLRSPHVVRLHEFGIHEGRPYLVMEYLDGESLDQMLARKGSLSIEETARICRDVAHALQEAHDHGIVHRDVKSSNIFLARTGEESVVKLVDFGLVTAEEPQTQDTTQVDLTSFGAMLGTAAYMSPEQFRDSRRVDHRTDLWALGVVCYECLTGRLPFEADNLALLGVVICHGTTPLVRADAALPKSVDAWFKRALSRERNDRFQSAEEMAEALDGWTAGSASLSPMSESVPPHSEPARKNSARRPFLAAFVLALAAGAGYLVAKAPANARPTDIAADARPPPEPARLSSATQSPVLPLSAQPKETAVPPPTAAPLEVEPSEPRVSAETREPATHEKDSCPDSSGVIEPVGKQDASFDDILNQPY